MPERMRQGKQDLEEDPLHLCFLLLLTEGAKRPPLPTIHKVLLTESGKYDQTINSKKVSSDLKPQNITGQMFPFRKEQWFIMNQCVFNSAI